MQYRDVARKKYRAVDAYSGVCSSKATTNRVVGSRPARNFQCMRAGGRGRDKNDVIVYLP